MFSRLFGKKSLSIFLLALSLFVSVFVYSDEDAQTTIVENENVIEKITQRGPVKAIVTLEPAKPLIGDIVTLTLAVTAEEGVELLMPEFGQSLDRFSIMDFVPKELIDDEGRTVALHKYRLQTPMSGQQSLPPLMVEFIDRREGNKPAPEGEDAYEILTERITFEVMSLLPEGAALDLKPPLGKLGPRAVPSGPKWPWVILVLVLLAVASPFIWKHWQQQQVLARRKSAYEIASTRLSSLSGKDRPADADSVGVFYVELSAIVRKYLEDRFELHAPELTTEEFLEVASASPDLNSEQKGFLKDFLHQADQVKFARHVPDRKTIDQALQAANQFIEQTKQNAPLIDQGEELSSEVSNA